VRSTVVRTYVPANTWTGGVSVGQVCAACSADNDGGARFCAECGTPLRPAACAACGAPTSGGRFCSQCGAPLTTAPAVAAPVAERRRTSVLFGDLVGFTSLTEARDAEEVRELLSRYFGEARTVVQRYGGTVEKFIGDAVMAVWGVPVAHEDDAERAVRAGLDLLDMVAALGEDVGLDGLALRVGVVTGEVAVTLGATGEGMVAGDAVNTAARVQTAAAPGQVWVDEATRSLTAAAVAYSDAGEHALKGKALPARLFSARTVVAAVGGSQRVDGLEAPFTGRDRELRLVKELLHAVHDEGRSRLVTVTGVAGVGKSRLGWEFEKYVDGLTLTHRWHRGRCLSYGEGVAFWAFAEMVRSRLGISESDDQAEVERKAAEGLVRSVPDVEERAWLAPRLGVLVGVVEKGSFDRQDLFAAWTLFLERVGAGTSPVVLVFEDMHHADAGLLDLVEHLRDTARFPLFVLVLGRPELLERRPGLTGGRRSTPLYLEPLSDAAMTRLVDGLVADLPATARTALVERAEGVPLYAVETVRSLIDRDAVVPRDGRYVFVEDPGLDLDRLAAPASLQTLIAARLDALSPDERHTAQDASVLGMSFTAESLATVSGVVDLGPVLNSLVRKEVLELQRDPRSPERGQYRFLQALVRQVAYDTLSRRDRKARHLAAAAHLGASDEKAELSAVLAQHHLDALDASSPDDGDRDELATRARQLLAAAAARAQALGSPQEALRHAGTALGRGATGVERADLLAMAAETARSSGDMDAALAHAEQARSAYLELGRDGEAGGVLAVAGAVMVQAGRLQQGVSLLTPVYDELRGRDDAGLALLRLATELSRLHFFLGEHQTSQRYSLEASRLAEAENDVAGLIESLQRLASALLFTGTSVAGGALLREAVARARSGGHTSLLARGLANLVSLTYPRDLPAASLSAVESVELARQVGDRAWWGMAVLNLCLTHWFSGSWDDLEQAVRDNVDAGNDASDASLELLRCLVRAARGQSNPEPVSARADSDDAYDRGVALLRRALWLAQEGRAREASDLADEAFRDWHEIYAYEDDFVLVWAVAVELAVSAGLLDRAAELLAVGEAARGASMTPLLRGHVALHRGLLQLARDEPAETSLRRAVEELTAYGAPYPRARAQVALAQVVDDPAEVAALRDDGTSTLAALGVSPALVG
jgi:class 3 adenylate cyclase/tetratricopeptide (TPR) repeat protein